MADTNTIPVFDPSGVLRDVPEDQLLAAVKAGGMPSVKFTDPGGTVRFVPANRTHEAIASGGKLQPYEQQDAKHAGVWQTIKDAGESIGNYISSIPSALAAPDPLADPRVSDEEKSKIVAQQQAEAAATNAKRTGEHGLGYSLAATAGEMGGVPVSQAEQHAEEGNIGGVIGDMLAVPATAALTHAAVKGGGAAFDFSKNLAENLRDVTPKQAAQVVGAGTGAGLGHGTLSVPGAYYGAKGAGAMAESVLGKERANAPIFKRATMEQPAPFPEKPPAEVLQANPLSTIGQPVRPEQASALGKVPGQAGSMAESIKKPTTFSGNTNMMTNLPPNAVDQAINELGKDAPIRKVAERANEIANAPTSASRAASDEAFRKMNPENKFSESHGVDFSKPQKPIDTDAFAKATEQARNELGTNASLDQIIARRNEIVKDMGVELPKGDVGEQARKDVKGPTREETRAAAAAKETPAPEPTATEPEKPAAPRSNYPPEAPASRLQPAKPNPADLKETLDIRDRIKNQAEAEDRARLRTIKGEEKMRQDASTPKGVLNNTLDTSQNDVSINRPTGEDVKAPDFTKLTKDIATPQQAMRQMELLKKAGASQRAMNDLDMRAQVKFGENWKHVAGQHDDLTSILQQSLDAENAKKAASEPKPTARSRSSSRLPGP